LQGGADPRCQTISFKDLKVFLQNMNIVVPDETIEGLFKYLDADGSGGVHAKEFIKTFGHAISGEKADNISSSDHVSVFAYLLSNPH
jgi:Ca2+-binding EF-hand superfamily protein